MESHNLSILQCLTSGMGVVGYVIESQSQGKIYVWTMTIKQVKLEDFYASYVIKD